jgi:hypothetical protein
MRLVALQLAWAGNDVQNLSVHTVLDESALTDVWVSSRSGRPELLCSSSINNVVIASYFVQQCFL